MRIFFLEDIFIEKKTPHTRMQKIGMTKELTIKQDDFWRLINREQFLWRYFNARLRYRIRTYLHFVSQLTEHCSGIRGQVDRVRRAFCVATDDSL